jgi:hypothetical protein
MKITEHISRVRLGQPQRHADISIFPLFDGPKPELTYQTMDPSLMRGDLEINEISQDGEVPLLEANNRVKEFILLLDSEEIMGAKQNRVLNTSILLPRKKRTTIPVSCTEAGRWAYATSTFQSSGNMMPKAARTKKMKSVTTFSASVAAACEIDVPMPAPACCYKSNQSEVWEEVAHLKSKTKTHSPTNAMSDVYEAMQEKVDRLADQFELIPGQKGILVMKNGEIMGMDLLSQPDAYEELHRKIVGSYVIESAIEESGLPEENSDEAAQAEAFLGELSLAEGEAHKSAGEGTDVRYDAPTLSGTALMHDEQLIHASFLRHDPQLPPVSVTAPYPVL